MKRSVSFSPRDAGAPPRRAFSLALAAHRRVRRPRQRPRARRLHRGEHAPGRAGGRAVHVGGLQLVPARRPLAVEAEGRPDGGRPRLPRRLLGSARLEGPLRERRVHRPPGGAAGEQRRPLQLHAAGRRRRPRPHRLVARHGVAPARACGGGRASPSPTSGDRFVATVTPAAGAPQRLAAYWAVTEQGHVTAVKAGENDGVTLHHDFVVRDYEPVAAWAARSGARDDVRLQAGDARPTRPIRAASTSSSSTPRPGARCRR